MEFQFLGAKQYLGFTFKSGSVLAMCPLSNGGRVVSAQICLAGVLGSGVSDDGHKEK